MPNVENLYGLDLIARNAKLCKAMSPENLTNIIKKEGKSF